MTIWLKGGPFDGERHRTSDDTRFFTQHAKDPVARYRDSGQTDPAIGHVIFVHAPRLRVEA